MSSWLLAASLVLALLGGVAVLAFDSPTRNAGGLITAFLGAAAASEALGAPVVPGFLLWVGAGGIGLLLLASVLLLNIRSDERPRPSLRLRPLVVLPLLAVLWKGLAELLLGLLSSSAELVARSAAGPPRALTALDVSLAVNRHLVVPFTVALMALAAALITAIALVRRRT